jgi:hydroxymethylpyrimidine/phosphomethylpyrimidine kinase
MIFKNINELRNCFIEVLEDYIPNEDYIHIVSEVDKIRSLELNDETKQNVCNNELRKVLIKNNVVPSYKIIEWLEERKEEYLDLMAYIESDYEWKKKHNIATE